MRTSAKIGKACLALTSTLSVGYYTVVERASSSSSTSLSSKESHRVQWAYPSPYEEGEETERRFVDAKKYRRTREMWDLLGLLKRWQSSEEEETWPWVWTQRNPNGPHFVFVGVDAYTLRACEVACESSETHNLTLVVRSLSDLDEAGYSPTDFYAQRCAIIESCPSQIDFHHKILMLEDERIVCYDTLTLAGSSG